MLLINLAPLILSSLALSVAGRPVATAPRPHPSQASTGDTALHRRGLCFSTQSKAYNPDCQARPLVPGRHATTSRPSELPAFEFDPLGTQKWTASPRHLPLPSHSAGFLSAELEPRTRAATTDPHFYTVQSAPSPSASSPSASPGRPSTSWEFGPLEHPKAPEGGVGEQPVPLPWSRNWMVESPTQGRSEMKRIMEKGKSVVTEVESEWREVRVPSMW